MKNGIKISCKIIAPNKPCFIIAEVGVNHNGSIKLAKKLVDEAKKACADAVKFQTFKTEEVVTKNAKQTKYQKQNSPAKSQYEMLKKLELSESEFEDLSDYCKRKKIIFLSTPFDFKSASFLHKLGVPAFKISSGDLTNIPFLIAVAKYKKPVILSTGMSTIFEVKEAEKAIYSTGNRKLILLHCTSNYPAKYKDINLRAMITLRKKFNVPVGYSDHTKGVEIAIAAVSLGACVIEKHLTLDKNLPGPDHKSSLEPIEFKKMVETIWNVELSMGNGVKVPRDSEAELKKAARKSIVAQEDIKKGSKLTKEMLAIKRPGTGIEPKYLNKLIGKTLKKNIRKNQILFWDKVKI